MSSFSDSCAMSERIPIFFVYIVGLLVKLIEQARVVFVHPRCYSNVALKPVVGSPWFPVITTSLNDNLNISHRRLVSRRHSTLFCYRQVSYLPIKR